MLLCGRCKAALTFLRGPLCSRCGAPTAWPVERCAECAGRRIPFESARAAVAYDDVARTLVAAWKERGLRSLTAVFAALVAETVPPPAVRCLAFVPGDPERSLWRGQNTAEALALALGRRWALPVVPLLERTRSAPRQRGLSRAARRANARGTLRVTARAPATLALVDDVYTTGATVSAAATELRGAGAGAVQVITFARAIRR